MTTYHVAEQTQGRMKFSTDVDCLPADAIRVTKQVFPDRESVLTQARILAQRGWHVCVDDEHGVYETDSDPVHKLGTWADNPCWYVTVMDGPKFALLLGPFRTESACREYAYLESADGGDHHKHLKVINQANELDPKSAFYSFGMSKMPNGYRTGVLNKHLQLANSEFYGESDLAGVDSWSIAVDDFRKG